LSVPSAAAAEALPRWNWPLGRKLGDWTFGFITFLGAFVIDEPAPYEILLGPIVVVWAVFGLRLNRHFAPMVVLFLLCLAGGLLGLTQLADPASGLLYIATTGILVLSAVFYAAVIATAPERLRFVKTASIASGVIASLLGIAGYFHLFPGAEIFTLYERVRGTFQDPNVFAPFLVLPIAFLFRDIVTQRLRDGVIKSLWLMILLLALFLAFSRAAWGMAAFSVLLVALLAFITERSAAGRLRIAVYFATGLVVTALLVVAVLSIPAVSTLFAERAHLVEDYDTGPLGRFGRHIAGFFLIQERPLGLGPLEFSKLFGEDEHNTWLKGFTTYGWLGGFAYIALAVWTLVAATPVLFRPRAWQALFQCIYSVFVGLILIHAVIDNDHWRQLFMLYGIIWGVIAAEKMAASKARRGAAHQTRTGLPASAPRVHVRSSSISRAPMPAPRQG
jgi:hypothetical protein